MPTTLDMPLGGLGEPAHDNAREELAPRLLAVVDKLESKKAAWEALRAAGLTDKSLNWFRTSVRAKGMGAVLAGLFVPERVDAIRAFVENPPAPKPRRVAVSTLANQFYCEMQVHLDTLHDVRVLSAEMAAGTAGHARFEAEAEPITDAEIERRKAAGEAMGLVELGMSADLGGVELVGRADRVQLVGERAKMVLEFKFSGRREMYPSHVAQVESYGTLLGASGYDIGGLVHAVAVLPRGARTREGLSEELASAALELAGQGPWAPREVSAPGAAAPDVMAGLGARHAATDAYALWVFPHDPGAAARDVGWALSYWKGDRPPAPTAVAAKCRACAHNAAGLCGAARAAPDGRYVAREVDGRKGRLHLLSPAR